MSNAMSLVILLFICQNAVVRLRYVFAFWREKQKNESNQLPELFRKKQSPICFQANMMFWKELHFYGA